MGRKSCDLNTGPWSNDENLMLINYIRNNRFRTWTTVPKLTGLNRSPKSCRLRWLNNLRPNLRKGRFTEEEDQRLIQLHSTMGSKWTKIAAYFLGRSDSEIKNHFKTKKIRKKLKLLGDYLDPVTHKQIDQTKDDKNKTNLEPNSSKGPEEKDGHDVEIMSMEGADEVYWNDLSDLNNKDQMLLSPLDLENSWIMNQQTNSTSASSSFFMDDFSQPSAGESTYLQENPLLQWVNDNMN